MLQSRIALILLLLVLLLFNQCYTVINQEYKVDYTPQNAPEIAQTLNEDEMEISSALSFISLETEKEFTVQYSLTDTTETQVDKDHGIAYTQILNYGILKDLEIGGAFRLTFNPNGVGLSAKIKYNLFPRDWMVYLSLNGSLNYLWWELDQLLLDSLKTHVFYPNFGVALGIDLFDEIIGLSIGNENYFNFFISKSKYFPNDGFRHIVYDNHLTASLIIKPIPYMRVILGFSYNLFNQWYEKLDYRGSYSYESISYEIHPHEYYFTVSLSALIPFY